MYFCSCSASYCLISYMMDVTNGAVWLAIALVFIAATITKADPAPPPVVNCGSLIGLLHTLFTKGLRAMIFDQYTKLGSVFTISFVGVKLTFLIGPEVSAHFYQGLDSEVSRNMHEFTVPMIIGKDVGYDIDEHKRIFSGALKASKLSSQVAPMLQEVEDYSVKWAQQGTVDLRQELENLFILITGRCLIGKEVREKMFDEFFTLFHEMVDNGMHLTSVVFPYGPTPMNRRRDRARAKLFGILTEIVRSRRSSKQVESDVMQKLLDSKYKDGRPTTESDVAGMIIALLIAGKHTSSTSAMWTGACLLSHKSFLEAAVMEQKQIIRKYGDHIDHNALLEMDTLHCCIKDASPDASVISQERFGAAREEDKVGGKFSYTSFGGGRHACSGEAYAYVQIKVIWSHLIRNFELEMVSPFPQTDWSKVVPCLLYTSRPTGARWCLSLKGKYW
ncbi:Obtusifoliol 14-alpha demethylase [Dichanthelium oligosanthes]|uniref:Obtusifoliol 14-alpha demethylase n=1 Tax=Dichanthelium oligosanthes TaxID=888268 RepID=A0A1E5VQI0_9POAL|nr:Obtusifoliol 14-alpha demethylase [Dichanthelium oligosanthes]